MKRTWMFLWAIAFVVLCMLFVAAVVNAEQPLGDRTGDEKSYYQYGPRNVVQPPASIWNPIITEKDGKIVKRSFYLYGPVDNKVLPPGSIWNPLVTIKDGN